MAEDTEHTGAEAAPDAAGHAGAAPAPGEPPRLPPTAAALAGKAKDLLALRDAVVDAASVGAGLWLSYLFVLFYLLIAAGGVTHRDLFLESPVKLPFLNVDLPLRGFFWLGPAIFLIVHAYVLLHFVLLAGKVGDFDAELRAQITDEEVRTRLRRQLPSNIFVQFLAGSREVRSGAMGLLLRLIAQISLVIGPIALLVFFELQFLPYHHEVITWWHRIAVVVDILLLWVLWPSIAGGKRAGLAWRDLRRAKILALAFASLVPVLLVVMIATMPNEWPQNNLPSLQFIPWPDERDKPWRLASLHELLVSGEVDLAARKPKSLWSNRLVLPGFDPIDHAKFDSEAKIAALSETVSLRSRHLEGAVLIGAKLRKADFTAAQLQGAQLDDSDLREAKFACVSDEPPAQCTQLQRASLKRAQLQGALLDGAQLQGALLKWARLQGASLNGAQLQGALLSWARLQGTELARSQLQGAVLENAHLQGAWLQLVQLQGAWLSRAQLWGAFLERTQLQGASLDHAYLQGALLDGAQLQGASLDQANLEGASFTDVFTWRADARKANWKDTRVVNPETGPKEECSRPEKPLLTSICEWSAESLDKLKKMIAEGVPESEELREALKKIDIVFSETMPPNVNVLFMDWRATMEKIQRRLDPTKAFEEEDEMVKVWEAQTHSSPGVEIYEERLAEIWRKMGCDVEDAPYMIRRFLVQLRYPVSAFAEGSPQLPALAKAFLDEEHCPGARGLTDDEKIELREIRDRSPPLEPKQ